jgi:sortase (surface protein transpeptidase)
VHDGPGALNYLARLRTGSPVLVRTATGERLQYRARTVQTFSKGTIADRAARLFSQSGRARLVLVTCADWNGVRYLSNTVVVATPA